MNTTSQLNMTLSPVTATAADPVRVYLASLSPGSRGGVCHALDTIALRASGGRCRREAMPWEDLGYGEVVELRAWLVVRYAPATAARMLAALRGVLREAFRVGLIPLEEHMRLLQVRSIPVRREPCGRRLGPDEAERLAAAAEPGAGGDRDRALVYLMLATAVRRAEVVALDLSDVRHDDRTLHVRGAKRGARRRLPISSRAWDPLQVWMATRGDWPGPLFTPVDQRQQVLHERLAPNSINFILRRLGGRAGLDRFSPHDCRRTGLTGAIEAGLDLFETSRLAGHRAIGTTAIYDMRGEEASRVALERYMGAPSPATNVLQLRRRSSDAVTTTREENRIA